ncbi:MAG TPA: exopolysaccharide biosynthesis polyprenyl glycosylphosphotransferase [Candidatus Pacearchaeota archaeon]|nr:exopolysaccharide biosynthesis polyprenyl glycosylphosphotransferase [Candidatus Pacearchaeota archaeon]
MSKKGVLKIIYFLGDIFLMYLSLFLALVLRHRNLYFWTETQLNNFFFHFSFIFLFWVVILYIFDFYEVSLIKKFSQFFYNLFIFIFLASVLGTAYFYLVPKTLVSPKTILFLSVFFFAILFFLWRYLLNQILKLKNFKEKIILVLSSEELNYLLPEIKNKRGYEIIKIFDNNSFDVSEIKKLAEKEKAKTIIFSNSFYKDKNFINEFVLNFSFKLNLLSFVDFYEILAQKILIEFIDNDWVLDNILKPDKKIEEFTKRCFDILFSFIGFLIFLVLLPFVALIIKIDSDGPVFFNQRRVGKNRKIFTLYKFRTMKTSKDEKEKLWREKDEKEITRVGKFLRRFHLDELPQFLNILKGDLSFVGPRPEWEKLDEIFIKEIPFYSLRYLVKPGFTGWAQLKFPPSTSVKEAKEKFKYDLYYIKNRNFFMDLGIILKTIQLFFR